MTRGPLAGLVLAALVLSACDAGPERTPGIGGVEARVVVDRSEAYVGDPVGVTVEVDVPAGYAVQEPFPQGSAEFVTDGIEDVGPRPTEWGTRYAWRWTLRPVEPGPKALPELRLPLTSSEGDDAPVSVGRLPLRVRSVRAELPERDALFDIRAAPARGAGGLFLWLSLVGIGAVFGAVWLRRRGLTSGADPRQVARSSLDALRELPFDSARERADGAIALVWGYVRERWDLEREGRTASDLSQDADASLAEILASLERARFARDPATEDVERSVHGLEEYWQRAVGA